MKKDNKETALLVMDMQAAMVGLIPEGAALVSRIEKAIASARSATIPVIYVVVGFREGAPEMSPNNKGFMAGRQLFEKVDMHEFTRVHPDLRPLPAEPVVIKRRVSAFTGSDLEVLLRARNIRHIVLTGIATGGVVLSTLREAADKDYRITVLSDCCADRDEEVHRVLTTKVFPRQADVLGLSEWMELGE
ncbi:MAG: cysteine hydrolase [Bacteroidetes bacterium]|nr:cysteine hydrolase [Bacteroidota bacterium]